MNIPIHDKGFHNNNLCRVFCKVLRLLCIVVCAAVFFVFTKLSTFGEFVRFLIVELTHVRRYAVAAEGGVRQRVTVAAVIAGVGGAGVGDLALPAAEAGQTQAAHGCLTAAVLHRAALSAVQTDRAVTHDARVHARRRQLAPRP